MTVTFRAFRAADALAIQLQSSQWFDAGVEHRTYTLDEAAALEAAGAAWTALRADGTVLVCAGLAETFAGRQAVAWALVSGDVRGREHVAICRYGATRIAESPLPRIEAIVRADPTGRGATWARAMGLMAVHVLRCWGADGDTYLLCERITCSI